MEDMRFRIADSEAIRSVRRDEVQELNSRKEREKDSMYCFFGSVNRCDFFQKMCI